MSIMASLLLAATLSSSEAVAILLNSQASTSATRYAEAVKIVRADAKKGKPLQQFVLGLTIKNEAESTKLLDASREKIRALSVKRDNPLAWYLLWRETGNDEYLKKAADGNNVQALNAYGMKLVNEGLDPETPKEKLDALFSEARDCFSRAVALKDTNACINLGTCYLRGFGGEIDLNLAFKCFLTAAEMGHPEGMDYVSASYDLGHGVERDHHKALVWMMKAKAVRGDKAAAEWLKK